MSLQGRNDLDPIDPHRRTGGRRPAARAHSVRQSAADCHAPQADDAARDQSLFSIVTIVTLIVLAACGAAAVAAIYGPVFTQPAIGP